MIEDRVLQWLLEADIDELEGQGESELARRVREDPALRKAARHIAATLREADAAIVELAAGQATRPRSARLNEERGQATRAPAHRPSHRRRPALAAIGVAAAAIMLLLSRAQPRDQPDVAVPDRQPVTASLEVSSSRPFAVFATDNPDIAVVWLFDEEER